MELFDPRGGSNRYKCQLDFFKNWSNEMAYVLGFLYADGDIVDAISSRTQYIKFSSKDREIIDKIKSVLKAEHPIHNWPAHLSLHANGKIYKSAESFFMRIGSRRVFADLKNLGLKPNKSKTMKFPEVPLKYVSHFIRGYFDGDGTIFLGTRGSGKDIPVLERAIIIFSCGSKKFIRALSNILAEDVNVKIANIYNSTRCFQISYGTKASIEIFKFMYHNSKGLFLKRKFDTFGRFFNQRSQWSDQEILDIFDNAHHYLATYPNR
jgi:hypothetical protein